MTFAVSNDNDSFESSSLAGASLLLNRFDLLCVSFLDAIWMFCAAYLHDFVLQLWQEPINNLILFDGKRMQVDLLHRLNLASFHESAKLGDWLPFLFVRLVTTSAGTSSTSTASAASISSTSITKAASASASTSCVSHVVLLDDRRV